MSHRGDRTSPERTPTSALLANLGLFVFNEFLDAELCGKIRSELRVATGSQAMICRKGVALVDVDARRTESVVAKVPTMALVQARLQGLRPALESHFNLRLTGCETPQFLIYKKGDFFLPHQDSSAEPEDPPHIKARRVSVVIFLNGETEEPGVPSYTGGSLVFYELIDDPRLMRYGLPLVSEPGMLVAFRSDLLHEVEAVAQGERYTIVSWFF